TRAMSLSAGVPHGVPELLFAVVQAESSKLVCGQLAGAVCAAFQGPSTAIFDTLPEANCTTSRPITLAASWTSELVAPSASTLVPACNQEVTLICAVASQRIAELVICCPFTNTLQKLSA